MQRVKKLGKYNFEFICEQKIKYIVPHPPQHENQRANDTYLEDVR